MERCFTFAATTVGASFCQPLPVPDRKVSLEAVVDKINNKTSSSAEIQPMDKIVLTKISTLENKEANL